MIEAIVVLLFFGIGVLVGVLAMLAIGGRGDYGVDDDVYVVGKDGRVKAVSMGDGDGFSMSAEEFELDINRAYDEYFEEKEGVKDD